MKPGEKKEVCLRNWMSSRPVVGERGEVERRFIGCTFEPDKLISVKITKIQGDDVWVRDDSGYNYSRGEYKINIDDFKRSNIDVGMNPFPLNSWHSMADNISFDLEGIVLRLCPEAFGYEKLPWIENGIRLKELNFNPFVYDVDGKKLRYQRDFVWTLEEKQNLISSIYHNIPCGKIVVRNRDISFLRRQIAKGDDETYFRDIVDGKQRVNTLVEFMTDKFPDKYGNYWSDLSKRAQIEFEHSHCFSYCELRDGTTDEQVLQAFLGINFAGVPQSPEHIAYVESIYKKEFGASM